MKTGNQEMELVSFRQRRVDLSAFESQPHDHFGLHSVKGLPADADSTKDLDTDENMASAGSGKNVQQISNSSNISEACDDIERSTAVFTIRGYVSYMRQENIRRNWPFSERSFQRHKKKGDGPLLPPFEPKPLDYFASDLGLPKYQYMQTVTQIECMEQNNLAQEVMLHLELDGGRSTADDTADVVKSLQYGLESEERKLGDFERKSTDVLELTTNLDVCVSQQEGHEKQKDALCHDTFIDEESDIKGGTQQHFVCREGQSDWISPETRSISERDGRECEMFTTTTTTLMNLEEKITNLESQSNENGNPSQQSPESESHAKDVTEERNEDGLSESNGYKRSFEESCAKNIEVLSQKFSHSSTINVELTLVNDRHPTESHTQEIDHRLQKHKGKTQKTRSITDIISSNSAVIVEHKTLSDGDRLLQASPQSSQLKVIKRKNSSSTELAREKELACGLSRNDSFVHAKHLARKRKQHPFEANQVGSVSWHSSCKRKCEIKSKAHLPMKELVHTRKRKLRTTANHLFSTPQNILISPRERCSTPGDADRPDYISNLPVTPKHGCLRTSEDDCAVDPQDGKQGGDILLGLNAIDAAASPHDPCDLKTSEDLCVQALYSCNEKSAKLNVNMVDHVQRNRSTAIVDAASTRHEVQPLCLANTQCEMSSLESSEIIFETNESLEVSDSESMQWCEQSENPLEVENQLSKRNIQLAIHSDRAQPRDICVDSVIAHPKENASVGTEGVCLSDFHTQTKISHLDINHPFADVQKKVPTEDLAWQHSSINGQCSLDSDQSLIERAMKIKVTSILSTSTENLEIAEQNINLKDDHCQLLNCGAVMPSCEKMIPPLSSCKPFERETNANVPKLSWKALVIMANLGLNVGVNFGSSLDKQHVSTSAGAPSPAVPLLATKLKESYAGIGVKSSSMGFYVAADYPARALETGTRPASEQGAGVGASDFQNCNADQDRRKGGSAAMPVTSIRPPTVSRRKKSVAASKSSEQIPKSRFPVSNISVSVGDRVLRTFPRGLPPGRYSVNADGARCLELREKIALQTPFKAHGTKMGPNTQGVSAGGNLMIMDSEVGGSPNQGVNFSSNATRENDMNATQLSAFPLSETFKLPQTPQCDEIASENVPHKNFLTTDPRNSSGQGRFSENSVIDLNDSTYIGKPMLRLMGKNVMPLSRFGNPQEQSWQCQKRQSGIQQHVQAFQSVHGAPTLTSNNALQDANNVYNYSETRDLPIRPDGYHQPNSSGNKAPNFSKPAHFFLGRQGLTETNILNTFNNCRQNKMTNFSTPDQREIFATELMQAFPNHLQPNCLLAPLKTGETIRQFSGNCSKQNAEPHSEFLNVRKQKLEAYVAANVIEIEDDDEVEPSSGVTSTSYKEPLRVHELGLQTSLDAMRSAEKKLSNRAVPRFDARQVDYLSNINASSPLAGVASQNCPSRSLLGSIGQELRAINSEQHSSYVRGQDLFHTYAQNTETTRSHGCRNIQTTQNTDLNLQREMLSRWKSNSTPLKGYPDPLISSRPPLGINAGLKRGATANVFKARVEMMKAGMTTQDVDGSPSAWFSADTHQLSGSGNQSCLYTSLPQSSVDCYDFLSKTSESMDHCKDSRLNDMFRVPNQPLDARNAFISTQTNNFILPEQLFMPSLSVAESLQNRSRQILMSQKPFSDNLGLIAPSRLQSNLLQRSSVPSFSPGTDALPIDYDHRRLPQSYSHLDNLRMIADAIEYTKLCKSVPKNSDMFRTKPLLDQGYQPPISQRVTDALHSGNPNTEMCPIKLASADPLLTYQLGRTGNDFGKHLRTDFSQNLKKTQKKGTFCSISPAAP